MEVIVHVEADVRGEHSVDGVVENVEAVAVFPEEAHGFVGEDGLGPGAGAECHGEECGAGDADDGEAEGGDEEVILPAQPMVDEASAYEDGSANGEDSGREFENLLAG